MPNWGKKTTAPTRSSARIKGQSMKGGGAGKQERKAAAAFVAKDNARKAKESASQCNDFTGW